MTTHPINEDTVEQATITWLNELGYAHRHGSDIADDSLTPERSSHQDVVLIDRLRESLAHLNRDIPADALDEALRKVVRPESPSLFDNNRVFHRLLVEGVAVEYTRVDGSIAGDNARLIDFNRPDANDWLVVNQFTVVESKRNRRPDVVLFVNGLPLAVIELKNPTDENATIWSAFNQLQTYQTDIPSLFVFNQALVVSDGMDARIGALGAGKEWFKPWRTIGGYEDAPAALSQLRVMLEGVFEKKRFLNFIKHFIVFEDYGGGRVEKKMAGYHQFHAVNAAMDETVRAGGVLMTAEAVPGRHASGYQPGGEAGDRRVGVVWHTQGAGKSLTMAFYAGCMAQHPALENPTVVVLTDRNDLDDQLFGTFSRCRDLLRQTPTQAASRADLREKLSVASGGVVFTTIQKFFPEEKGDRHPALSTRRNIVVIADEAHRSQYDFIDGFARHIRDALPGASFVAFTGTPIEHADANTRAVFGDYISIYDMKRAAADNATVTIYYESRLVKLELSETERPNIDPDFEEATESEEKDQKEKLKTKWAALESVVGSKQRVGNIARDLVEHFEQRLEVMEGKAMVVAMSRRIAVDLYGALTALKPEWHSEDDEQGALKVVMTGAASDPPAWQMHIRNKARREALANRFRDAKDPFRIVIVRDMWLTGFDAPSLHTMYVDKPMRGHGLMQTIARVNRVFKNKPGGLVVDYLGLADELQKAMATYTEAGGRGAAVVNQDEAVTLMREKHEVCCGLFHRFDWSAYKDASAVARLTLLATAQEHILAQEEGKKRLLNAVTELSQVFALAVPHEEAMRIRDDVGFFQTVRSVLAKRAPGESGGDHEMEQAIRQIISKAVVSDGVVDVFAAAGLKKPDISILSDEFLGEVRDLPQRNLAVEVLQKLLKGEIRTRSGRNVVQARSFTEMLERALRKYQNRTIEASQVIEELITLAREMRAAQQRGEALGLSEDEVAFYDALEANHSSVAVLGDETLKQIAQELVGTVRRNVTIDWTVKETVRAKLRVMVKRILRKYGYPPDKQEKATQTVLEQAEALCVEWVV